MSEDNNTPSKQTSSIPLKKETVRVTLKASDAPVAPAPVAPPTGPVIPKPPTPTLSAPPAVATAPVSAAPPAPSRPAPTATKAPAPAPTIPLKTAGPPTARPAPAPTIKLNTASGIPGGAPTIALKTAPLQTPAAPTVGLPGAPKPGNTVALPKATVQLAPPTQPLQTGSVSATQMATFQGEEEEEKSDTLGVVLSIFGFLAACGVLYFQCQSINIWDGWDKLF